MQKYGQKDRVKTNKKNMIRAISTAGFLTDSCPKRNKESAKLLFFNDYKEMVKTKHLVQWGRLYFIPNKRSHTNKMKTQCITMMIVGYALNHPSGQYEFYNTNTDAIITSSSVN